MSEALLPCPFCGGSASIDRYGDRRQSTIYLCDECGCRLETGETWGHGAAWNRRTSPRDPQVPGDKGRQTHVEAQCGDRSANAELTDQGGET